MSQLILTSPSALVGEVFTEKYDPEVYFSGIVLNQNKSVTGSVSINTAAYYQTFNLPQDLIRGVGQERTIPSLTGIQVLTTTQPDTELTASLSWTISYYQFGVGWVPVQSGTSIGSHATGKV